MEFVNTHFVCNINIASLDAVVVSLRAWVWFTMVGCFVQVYLHMKSHTMSGSTNKFSVLGGGWFLVFIVFIFGPNRKAPILFNQTWTKVNKIWFKFITTGLYVKIIEFDANHDNSSYMLQQ